MSITLDFERNINGANVAFHATVQTADEALTTIAALMADVAAAVATKTAAASTAKNSTAAKNESAAPSTDAKTPTASDSSANSSQDTNAAPEDKKADAAPPTENTVALDYDKDVKPLVLEISKTSRDNATALLQRHGAIDKASGKPSAKALKPEQYAAFVADANAVIAGTLDPKASTDGDIA